MKKRLSYLCNDATGLYDPLLGRFTQPDTIVPDPANPQSLNRYAYVLNNPLRYTDPSGHKACDSFDPFGKCIEEPRVLRVYKWFNFIGNFTPEEQQQASLGAITLGSAHARILNRIYRDERRMLARLGDPVPPLVKVTARGAFMQAFGGIVTIREGGGNYCERVGYGIQCGITINARLVVHELGHLLRARVIGNPAYTGQDPYNHLGNTTIVNVDGEHVTGLNQNGRFERTNLGYKGSSFPWQQHPLSMDGGNTPGEDFADMYLNWAFNSFSDNSAGAARYAWMNVNMAEWISAANW